MAAPQKPETFMLSTEAQQALPHDAQVALQQVDNCKGPSAVESLQLVDLARDINTKVLSEILPHLCTRRLATRPVHPKIPSAHG